VSGMHLPIIVLIPVIPITSYAHIVAMKTVIRGKSLQVVGIVVILNVVGVVKNFGQNEL
jgi:hypothetical protein